LNNLLKSVSSFLNYKICGLPLFQLHGHFKGTNPSQRMSMVAIGSFEENNYQTKL